MTPESTRKRQLSLEKAPVASPFVTTLDELKLSKKTKDLKDLNDLSKMCAQVPTPLTLGTSSKKLWPFSVKPSPHSKGLTAQLLSMADEPEARLPGALDASPAIISRQEEPVTPPSKPRIEQKPVFDPFPDTPEGHLVIVDVDELKSIPKWNPANPFVSLDPIETKTPETSQIDFSTHLELVNHRTGERRIEELSDEQRRMKPRRLDFSQHEGLPVKPNYNITNRYIENTLGPKFSMDYSQAKRSAGFDIFSSSSPSPSPSNE